MAESKEESLKPRILTGIIAALAILVPWTVPNSTRAYIPYVQPQVEQRPLPRVKKTEYVFKKEITAIMTGYFAPLREDYETEDEYLEDVEMNGEGIETNSSTVPKIGTVAADTSIYPFGTIIFIPSKNFWGTVEDIGPKVKGKSRFDLFCGKGKKAKRIALTWGDGTEIKVFILKKVIR